MAFEVDLTKLNGYTVETNLDDTDFSELSLVHALAGALTASRRKFALELLKTLGYQVYEYGINLGLIDNELYKAEVTFTYKHTGLGGLVDTKYGRVFFTEELTDDKHILRVIEPPKPPILDRVPPEYQDGETIGETTPQVSEIGEGYES